MPSTSSRGGGDGRAGVAVFFRAGFPDFLRVVFFFEAVRAGMNRQSDFDAPLEAALPLDSLLPEDEEDVPESEPDELDPESLR